MKIYIDGDGCSVLHLAEKVAMEYKVECHVYCDPNHNIKPKYAEMHIVEKGPNSADFAIVNKMEKGDVVVTNDSGLASMVLSKGGIPINSRGTVFTHENISSFLNSRYLRTYARKKSGRNQVKGMLTDTYAKHDNEKPHFVKTLKELVQAS